MRGARGAERFADAQGARSIGSSSGAIARVVQALAGGVIRPRGLGAAGAGGGGAFLRQGPVLLRRASIRVGWGEGGSVCGGSAGCHLVMCGRWSPAPCRHWPGVSSAFAGWARQARAVVVPLREAGQSCCGARPCGSGGVKDDLSAVRARVAIWRCAGAVACAVQALAGGVIRPRGLGAAGAGGGGASAWRGSELLRRASMRRAGQDRAGRRGGPRWRPRPVRPSPVSASRPTGR